MGSRLERFLKQLAQIKAGGFGAVRPCDNPPNCKAAIEPMPPVVVVACPGHIDTASHYVICKQAFELGD